MSQKPCILVVDDEEGLRELLKANLGRKGYRVQAVETAEKALQALPTQPFDLVITDLRLPGMSGEDLVIELKKSQPSLPVVVISAYGNTRNVVEVIKKGAEDYLSKPFTPEELEVVALKAVEKRRLLEENERLRRQIAGAQGLSRLSGRSKAMREVTVLLERLAQSDATVLITGESGTGKELAARAIHELSPRHKGPFVEVNAGSLPASLFEAEIFGARKGAYTGAVENREGLFQAADGGTLFLDEVGEVPLESQAKLLRALESREIKPIGEARPRRVDVRVVGATNQDLQALVDEGRFRKDLFFRLSVLPLRMPSLRERMEDLPHLAEGFLARFATAGAPPKRLSPEALKRLLGHSWPGNVRELRNVLERAALLSQEPELRPEDFLFAAGGQDHLPSGPFMASKRAVVEAFEKHYVVQALRESGGNVSRAASEAGMARKNFQVLVKKHRVRPRDFGGRSGG